MTDDFAELDPSTPVHLTAAGVLKDGKRNDDWFKESVRLSKRALAEGREWADRELQSILDERDNDDYDDDD